MPYVETFPNITRSYPQLIRSHCDAKIAGLSCREMYGAGRTRDAREEQGKTRKPEFLSVNTSHFSVDG
jgi:hypothetical protein